MNISAMIDEVLGKEYVCSCGRTHTILTKKVYTGSDAYDRLPGMMKELDLKMQRILLVADHNTFAAAGEKLLTALAKSDIYPKIHLLDGEIHANEWCIGSVMLAAEPIPDLFIAVGSGSINDIVRFTAHRLNRQYISIPTAPSVDGFASNVAPVVRGGFKITYEATAPVIIASDSEVLASAPLPMLSAGFADILGKYTALLDWQLSNIANQEYLCPTIFSLVEQALAVCMEAAPRLVERDVEAVRSLMDGLTLSGIGMQMIGNSRPASGCEHHISHFLEMKDAVLGRPATLHGVKVGMGTILMMRFYEKFFGGDPPEQGTMLRGEEWEKAVANAYGPLADAVIAENINAFYTPEQWRQQKERVLEHWDFFREKAAQLPEIRKAGERAILETQGTVSPIQLGYSKQDMLDDLKFAKEVRTRYTILRLAQYWGNLDTIAEEIIDEIYQSDK